MAKNKVGRRGGQRIGKPVLSTGAKRRRLIKRALLAWVSIALLVGIVRACAIRTGHGNPSAERKDILPHVPLPP